MKTYSIYLTYFTKGRYCLPKRKVIVYKSIIASTLIEAIDKAKKKALQKINIPVEVSMAWQNII